MGVNEQSDAAVGCVFVNRFLFSQAFCSMCLSCLRETGEAKQPKTMMLYFFRQSSCLKLTETSVLHVKV